MRLLRLEDIADQRAYERERAAFRAEVIAAKKLRRIGVGPLVSIVFENAMTMRFQIQEMARAERLVTDAQIAAELAVYNALIPGPGELRASMFIELRTPEELATWLPLLVGIERAVRLVIGADAGAVAVPATVDPDHAAQLTREATTAAVHYLRFELGAAASRFVSEDATIVIDHPAYRHEAPLGAATRRALAADWVDDRCVENPPG